MKLESVGHQTDLFFLEEDSIVEHHADAIVIKSPSNPEFFFGNYLIFNRSNTELDVHHYVERFNQAFSDAKGINHVAFSWDIGFPIDQLSIPASYSKDLLRSLTFQGDMEPPKKLPFFIKPIETDSEWDQVKTSQAALMLEFAQDDVEKMLTRRISNYRRLIENGEGIWLGAFDGSTLAGNLGIFHRNNLARFQNVSTTAQYRSRGICKTLIKTAVQLVEQKNPYISFVIQTEQGSIAEQIYLSLGFIPTEEVVAVYQYKKSDR